MKTIKKFTWAEVSPSLGRALLAPGDTKGVLRTAAQPQIVAALTRRYGAIPPVGAFVSGDLGGLLRDHWLPKLSRGELLPIALQVANHFHAGLPDKTKHGLLDYITSGQNLTLGHRTILRRAFLDAHKRAAPVLSTSSSISVPARMDLHGLGTPRETTPYDHEAPALRALRMLYPGGANGAKGLLVLPTGGGKTAVTVRWLLEDVLSTEGTRVLWLAHQRELLLQARATFVKHVAERPPETEYKSQLVVTGAGPLSLLGDDETNIAFVSLPTLAKNFDKTKRMRLKAFLARPTVVVVDEAHHGGAETYHQVLQACVELGARSVLGLTATPWPSALLSAKRFREIFGKSHDPVFQISAEELTEKEVLARPIYHVVESDETYLLSEEEVARSEKAIDIDPEVLGKLNDPRRNRVVVESYLTKQRDLGKTLVFAGSIAHAEALLRAFKESGVPVRAIHGQADTSRDKALEWFADVAEPAVLVSVRMLTEGVDLPHARSVILARPTTSRILLRQMVGRALRGRRAGGSDVAHIVYIRDQWEGLGDLLEPPEVLEVVDIETRTDRPRPGRWGDPWELGDLPIVDDEGQTLPASVEVEVERMVSENRQHLERVQDEEDRDFPVRLTTSALVGWYELPMRRIAVFEHQRAGFDGVIASAGENLQGTAVSQAFDDIAPPRPSRRTLRELREHVQTFGVPRFTPFIDRSLPRSVAEILSTGSRTDAEVGELIRTTWRTGAVRLSMSLREFEEEVDAERRRLRHKAQGEPGGLSPESAGTVHEPWDLPTLPFVERDLKPLVSDVRAWMAEETPTLVDRISPQLKVKWSDRVVGSNFGYWTLGSGRTALKPRIVINRVLSTHKTKVSDEMLAYLLYHELLHEVFPTRGHDQGFRNYEAKWPDAVRLDALFDTLSEQYDLRPESYRT